MSDAREDERWDVLIERYLEGTLFPEERARLRRRLEADPAFRERFVGDVVQESRLRTIGRETAAARGALQGFVSPLERAFAVRRARRRVTVFAAAALLGAVGGALWVARGTVPPAARIVRIDGGVTVRDGGNRIPARAGGDLLAGQGLETDGGDAAAVLACPDGTRLELGGETRLAGLPAQGDGPWTVTLERGRLEADVPPRPGGAPFVLATPHARAEVVGTRLACWVTEEATRLEVREGRVRIARRVDGAACEVAAGRFVVAGAEAAGRLAPREMTPPYAYYETVLNPSFEEDADGDGRPDHWSNTRIRRDAERAHDGVASMRVEGPDAPGAYSRQFFRLQPGTRYRMTAWLRTHGVAGGLGRGVRLRFVQLSPAPLELAATPWMDGTRAWERIETGFVTPADHRYGRLDIQWSLGEGETVWADAVGLERVE